MKGAETVITFEQLRQAEHDAGADSVSACEDDGGIPECEWRARIIAPMLGYVAIEASDGSVVKSA